MELPRRPCCSGALGACTLLLCVLVSVGPGVRALAGGRGGLGAPPLLATTPKECDKPCVNGACNPASGQCLCQAGWVGDQCQHCGGRFRLNGTTGYVTDGPGNYKYKTKCTWLIEGFY